MALPDVRWSDSERGAILYEDLGSIEPAVAPNCTELTSLMWYLARLHAAGIVEPAIGSRLVPLVAEAGWPSPNPVKDDEQK